MKERKMNEKVAQALHKGKEIAICTWEIAKPVCIKSKALALQGYEKGNELMDKVAFLQKPLHKKIVWGAIGLVFLWIVFPSGSNGGSAGLTLRERDFKKESPSDKMFYVTDGKDDGFKKVVPNLKKLPKTLSPRELCANFDPKEAGGRPKKGIAYFTDENRGNRCRIVYAGDGYVIAEPESKSIFGDWCGYIETDEEHLEGQYLKTGVYAFTGIQKVPLVNGSTQSMYSFKRLDDKSNKVVIEVAEYNRKATNAAEEENIRRYYAKKKHDTAVYKEAFDKTLARLSSKFKVRPISEQIHLPPELKSKSACFTFKDENTLFVKGYPKKLDEVQRLVKDHNWRGFCKLIGVGYESDVGNPEEEAEIIMQLYLLGTRDVRCSSKELRKAAPNYVFVRVAPGFTSVREIPISWGFNEFDFTVHLCADVYVVPESEKGLLSLRDDPSKFVAEFNRKYGDN